MSEIEAVEGELPFRPQLRTVELGKWPALGSHVTLELARRSTVLVGKNGAGKSVLLEGIDRGARRAIFPTRIPGPGEFRCVFELSPGVMLNYEYFSNQRGAESAPSEADDPLTSLPTRLATRTRWMERCWYPGNSVPVWEVRDGSLSIGGVKAALPVGVGLLAVVDANNPFPVPTEAYQVRELLAGFRRLQAGVPRSHSARAELALLRGSKEANFSSGGEERIARLGTWLTAWKERDNNRYDEFVALLQRLGLANEVDISILKPAYQSPAIEQKEVALVTFDGVNIGLLSDGTLRVTEILRALVSLPPGSLLLIEEPETAVHPGLLTRLLAVIESYSIDRQIVISTHSPLVVDWAKPGELRLVVRESGVTSVHNLNAEQASQLAEYLEDNGILSEFVFGGGID